MKSYNGRNIISGYAKWFGVDKICAIIELKIVGYPISEDLEKHIRTSLKAKKKKKKEVPIMGWESDENFAMIMGYTSGGAPYGITYEEYELFDYDGIDDYENTIEEYELFNFDEIYEDNIINEFIIQPLRGC